MNLTPQPLGSGNTVPLGSSLRLTSWNVWFDRHQRETRFPGLLDELKGYAPDLMAFQEVTMPFVRAVLECEWLKDQYWVSATEPDKLGTLFVGRLQIERLWFSELPSDMGRRLLLCQVTPNLRVATCHLESSGRGLERRKQQLVTSFARLKDSPQAVLLGDFNFSDGGEECGSLDPGYTDAWGDSPESFTMDSSLNPCLRRRGPNSPLFQARIDRLLHRGLERESRGLLGTEMIADGLCCSDHFGLRADFLTG